MTTTNKKIKGNGKKSTIEKAPAALPVIGIDEQRSQAILDAVTTPIVISRLADSQVLYANQAMAQMERVDPILVLGTRTVDYFADPADRNKVVEGLQQCGQVNDYEAQLKRGDGSLHWALISARVLDYQGETCVLSSYVDITGRKQAEVNTQDEKQRFQTILETIRIPTIISRISDGQVLYANQAIAEISQVSRENLRELTTSNFYTNSADQEKIREALRTSGHVDDLEVQFRRADGSLYWALLSSRFIQYEGETCVLSSYVDITERKQAEEALSESEDRFRRFTEATGEGLVFHEQGKIIDANPAGLAMFGLTESSNFVGRNLLEFVLPEYHRLIVEKMQMQDVAPYEVQCIRFDHSVFPVETSTRTLKRGDRTIRATSIREITERKRVEEALRAHDEFSQKQSSVFAELTRSEALYSGDTQAAFAEVTEAAARTLNIQRSSIWYYNEDHSEIRCMDLYEEGKGHSSGIVLGKADFPAYFKALEDEKVIAADNAHTDPATREFSAVYLTPLGINSMLDAPIRLRGRVIGVICNEHVGPVRSWSTEEQNFARTIVDFVTVAVETQERKQAETELQESEAQLSSALRAANMGHWEFDLPTQTFTFNDQYYSLHGRTAQEIGGYQMSTQRFAQELVYPEDAATVGQTIQKALESPDPNLQLQSEARIMHADGKPRWVAVWFRVERDARGIPVKLHGVNQDITERILAQEAIQKSEANYRAIADFTYGWETWLSPEGKFLYVSPACERISEYPSDAFIDNPRLFSEIAHPEDRSLIEDHLHNHHSTADIKPIEFRIITKSGRVRWISHSCRAIHDATGTWQGRRASNLDITERKQAEQFLQQSEANLSSALHVAQMGHWEFDVPTGMFTFNDQYYSLHSTTAEKVGGYQMSAQRFAQEFVYPEDAATVGQTIQKALESPDPNFQLQTEARIMRNGEPRWVTVWFRVERDAQGHPVKLHGVNQDINERKLVEEALRAHDEFSQKQSSVFAELTRSEALYSGDTQAAFAEVTEAAARTLNIQRSSIWYYNEDRTEIRCMDLYEEGKGHSSGIVLGKADFPAYFKALEAEKVIAADNAHTDPATREFSAVYLTPLGINSMLDAPIRLRGRVIGVICNEHVGPVRSWSTEEQNFARTIVDFVTVAVETQERKLTEAELLQSESNLSSALQVAQMGHWEYDVASGMFTFNDQYYSLHGTTAEKAGGYQMSVQKFAQEFVYPEDAASVGLSTQQAIETTDPNFQIQIEARIMHTDGRPRWVTVWFRVEKDAQGRTIRLHGVNQDITERKQAETELQREKALSDAIINGLPGVFYLFDTQGKMFRWNKQYEQMMAFTPEEAASTNAIDAFADEDKERVMAAIQRVFVEKQATVEANFLTKDGRHIPHYLTGQLLQFGEQLYLAGTGIDITERKRLEAQVQEALERRGLQVQLSTKVAQSIAAAASLQELYERVVAQVKEQFDYYHTQILRYDNVLDAVVLVNGYGEVGAHMLADGHRLPMGEGLIGTAAATGQTVLRSVLENDPDWHPNPLLPETKGEIAVPIKLGETILGVLDVQSNASGALDEEDQLLLEGLCGQVAVAIESTRLREEMTERLEEINRLYHAMSHEGWQTYRQTADLPTSFVYDQAGLRPVQDIGLAEELFARAPLAVPGGEVIGTLAIANDPQRPITPEDEDFLQQVSQQVALALEGARLFEQTQEALGQVRRRASELETVAAVSTTASGALDPEVLLQSVVNLTKERFGLYHAHIYLFDPERNELVLTAGAGEVGRKMLAEGWSIPVSHELSIVANAYRKQQSVVANDLHHDKQSGFLSNRLLPNTRSEMALPLVVGDQVLGVFDVQSEEANNFTSEDVNIYTTLASQVAVALQNARLYVEQARTVAQLRELDKLKSSFLANMSHELRTPLNSILGFADVILEELDGPLTENMNNDLRLIQKNGQHLLHLINDVLDMAKIEAGRMNLSPERFTAFEMLEEVTSITSTLASEKNLSLFIDEGSDQDVQIYADRTRMRQVMINLVNNAIKFTETGKISLKLASLAGARILITVKDTGIGIPPDKLEPIFQEFTQVDASSTRKAGGTGLGLPISRRLVEMHGGRLWAESTGIPGEGSTFCVELPVEARITETVEKQVK